MKNSWNESKEVDELANTNFREIVESVNTFCTLAELINITFGKTKEKRKKILKPEEKAKIELRKEIKRLQNLTWSEHMLEKRNRKYDRKIKKSK